MSLYHRAASPLAAGLTRLWSVPLGLPLAVASCQQEEQPEQAAPLTGSSTVNRARPAVFQRPLPDEYIKVPALPPNSDKTPAPDPT